MSDSKERIQREIEAKKKKLEELKKKRAAGTTVETPTPVPASTSTDNLPSAEELLSSISSLIPPSSDTSSSSHSSSSSSAQSAVRPPSANGGARLSSLANVKGPTVDITPTERIFYEVAVQADIAGPTTTTAASVAGDDKGEEGEGWIAKEAELQSLIQQLKDENKSLKGGKDGGDGKDGEENIRELKASEREEILSSTEFQNFFSRSSLMLERALSIQENQYDFTVNYSEAGEEKEEDGQAKGEAKLRQKFVFTDAHHSAGRAVTSIDWSPKYKELILSSYAARDDASSSTSADGVASALGDPDGTVLVWNMHLNNRPEYVFHCSSAVLSATFHPTHPRLIIGACWSGQIVIWDTREKSTPIARSSLAHGHTQPVHSMSLHSPPHLSGLAHLITMSQDGQLCVWEENNLHKPIHENLLRIAPPQNAANAPFSALSQVATLKDEISAYAFDFPGRDPSTLLLASDEGHIYKAKIYEKDGIYETVSAHEAPITAIQFHPMHKSNNSGIQLSASAPTADIFLTSSYDWTIKLWSNKLTSSLSAAQASFPSSTSSSPSVPISVAPLISIENGRDYVYDVRWHPKTPYLFASVDGSGTIDLYNILDDNHDVPAYSIQIGDQLDKIFQEQTFAAEGLEGEAVEGLSTSSSSAREPRALSRLRWSDDGRQLACGTSVGSLHVLELASDYCEASRESINNFYEKINKLHSQAQTANLLNSSPSTAFSAQV